jgi:hypothetical protein
MKEAADCGGPTDDFGVYGATIGHIDELRMDKL